MTDKVEYLLENYTLEEILELSDISPEEALTFLFMGGFINLPFLEYDYDTEENED